MAAEVCPGNEEISLALLPLAVKPTAPTGYVTLASLPGTLRFTSSSTVCGCSSCDSPESDVGWMYITVWRGKLGIEGTLTNLAGIGSRPPPATLPTAGEEWGELQLLTSPPVAGFVQVRDTGCKWLSEVSEISRTYEARPGVSSERRALALRAKAGPSMLFLFRQGRSRL